MAFHARSRAAFSTVFWLTPFEPMTTSRAHFEAQRSALAKFALARACNAPEGEHERLRDLAALLRAQCSTPARTGQVLVRVRGLAGQPAFSRFIRILP